MYPYLFSVFTRIRNFTMYTWRHATSHVVCLVVLATYVCSYGHMQVQSSSCNSKKRGRKKYIMAVNKANQKDFKWTDDEAELLLSVTLDYKAKKAAENVDWESVKSKYDDILVMMQAEMPAEKTERPIKDYPHLKSETTRALLSTKLKNMRQRYRQAVDSDQKSGHGRVVLLYYETCQAI